MRRYAGLAAAIQYRETLSLTPSILFILFILSNACVLTASLQFGDWRKAPSQIMHW